MSTPPTRSPTTPSTTPKVLAALSLSDAAVLAALGEGPAHGFKLAALFAKGGNLGMIWTVQRPQVYRALEHLCAHDLARTARQEAGEGGPPRLVYALTGAGKGALTRWLDLPVTHLRDARSELLLKLVFLERLRREPTALLSAQITQFGNVRRVYEARLSTARGAERLALEWRLEAVGAALRFLEERT